ncbi:MAG: hypothetical protein AAFV07_12790, partial [Bacteroidota bacterium]
EQEVKLAAEDLLRILFDAKEMLLVQAWHKEPRTQERVRERITDILEKHLPDSYGRKIFTQKTEIVYQHFFELAQRGRGFAA